MIGGATLAAAQTPETRVLDRVFLVRDKPGTPMRFEMVVNAGCNDEANGDCRGLAHYLEHLILVGRNAEHSETAFRFFADASSNGWTNSRATVYLHTVPARPAGPAADVEKLFQFYAARLRDFSITEADAARERNVVLQEHDQRVQSSPTALFWRDANRRLISDHPSGQWTIGSRASISGLTLEAARAFHKTWYVPNNVWFVIRADMEPEALKAIAQAALAGIADSPLPARNFDRPIDVAPARIDEEVRLPKVVRPSVSITKAFRFPGAQAYEARAARNLLIAYLSSQLTGSAYDRLVESEEIADERVSVSLSLVAPDVLTFTVGATPAEGIEPRRLREALLGWMDRLAANGPPDEAVLRRLVTREQRERSTLEKEPGRVQQRLVNWLAGGLAFDELARWPQRLAAVRPDDLTPLLQAMSGPGRVMTVIIEPEMRP